MIGRVAVAGPVGAPGSPGGAAGGIEAPSRGSGRGSMGCLGWKPPTAAGTGACVCEGRGGRPMMGRCIMSRLLRLGMTLRPV
jgi:hypothetical protein